MGEVAASGINATASGVNTYMQGQSNEAIANKQLEASKYASSTSAEASKYAADKNFETAKQQLDYAKQIYGEQSAAYKQALQNAESKAQEAGTTLNDTYTTTGNELAGGYQSAIEQAGQTPQEIQTLKSDIESGNAKTLAQGRNQMAANLATSGVRGGQAATLMNRGSGEQAEAATQNVNKLMADTANQSKAYQQQLLASKLAAQQSLGQQKISGQEANKQALQNFLYNSESAKYAR
jgi:hypothetical protein